MVTKCAIMVYNITEMIEIDTVDKQILHLLEKSADLTSQEIGSRIKMSSSSVRRRVRRLTKLGILRTVAVSDSFALGYTVTAVITLKVSIDQVDSVVYALSKRNEVIWAATVSGRFDVIAITRFRSTEELSRFIKQELINITGLKDTETFICLHVEKQPKFMM
jgi:Lrp/AsnC family transcriptional regulator, regulator for asnA, asnC and gidA